MKSSQGLTKSSPSLQCSISTHSGVRSAWMTSRKKEIIKIAEAKNEEVRKKEEAKFYERKRKHDEIMSKNIGINKLTITQ